ncbi:unnamed protein product [Arabidopsis lyrata]|uniref:DUF740 family protein n=1 Tax=Arabidopsis lyrata subsp. lyrata TaxID=81972 RepID=D7KHM5_ARALL|nr:uncharacterized protein LOC9327064 [Arabidopsis lyrata subsp. lyrata]EFH69992.1 hypothetical protein ARALYDRAFT_890842 [Arabidopsis lyrata subsp. lyrata]CAH8254317.1 unnamed protein product [Arabidopsis lyrata]|eukprot:XP_002893733.1 uncharacterized protein LOC9327064 [Arabidopsis lyrata subsp. lyrata]
MDEDGFSQCSKHFSKRGYFSGGGVCPFCLYERLSSLCPDCAHDLPCSCSSRAAVSFSPSSSSSSSSFSIFAGDVSFTFSGVGSVGRVASLIECEPAFRRSKSMAVPIKPDSVIDSGRSKKTSSFWRMFMGNRGDTKPAIMRKSRSIAVAGESGFSPVPVPVAATGKGKGWNFPSPIKVFRQSRVSKMIFQQRSPLYRG